MAEHADGTHAHDEQLARLAALSTSGVSDALDRLAMSGQCLGGATLDRSFRLAGRAYTLRYGQQAPSLVAEPSDMSEPGGPWCSACRTIVD